MTYSSNDSVEKRCFRDFQLTLPTVLENCIVPVLPLRLNFLHLVSDFVERFTQEKFELFDVGCGPYAILSLLALKLFKWRSSAFEPVKKSQENARKTVEQNGLVSEINVLDTDSLSKSHNNGKVGEKRKIYGNYVLLCNPPWFSGQDAANHEKVFLTLYI